MRFRAYVPLLAATCLAGSQPAHAADKPEGAAAPQTATSAPPWMASYEATEKAPIGIDESDLSTWLVKTHKNDWPKHVGKNWEDTKKTFVLAQTPSHTVSVPAFSISKYEVTNAQWEQFLKFRTEQYEIVGAKETLESVARVMWTLDESDGTSIQRGWKALLRLNYSVLQPTLDPDKKREKDPKWDPVVARVQTQALPKGLKLSYPRYIPPPHWIDGALPEHERKKPMHYLSWEQAVDFCGWAGFHLPTEFEWERAARGVEGRLLPWGNEWDPLKAVWKDYNRFAIRAANPDAPALVPPGASEAPSELASPADVDFLPAGATPEGVLNLAGNVSEYTSSRLHEYPETKAVLKFKDGSTVVVRGGNYHDRAEILLASDRNTESGGGTLLPSHSIDANGFRLAAYPLPGADVAQLPAWRWNATSGVLSIRSWLPLAPGCKDAKESEPFLAFDLQRTAGVLTRQLAEASPDHVFVTGPATGLALLPVAGVPQSYVKTVKEFQKLATDPDRPALLGVLVGTENGAFDVLEPGGAKRQISFSDPALAYVSERMPERVLTQERIGAVLLFDGNVVRVYRPNDRMGKVAKYRDGELGTLEAAPEITIEKGIPEPTFAWQGNVAVLTTSIPMLDAKGRFPAGGSSLRVTVKVPFHKLGK